MKKLYKSKTDKKICGVCGGLADYLQVDPTIVRLLMFLFVWCVGIGLAVYIAAALIMPFKDEVE
ncbi:MAG: PspC domain-containing protein [Clostridia bacterium]|nr:PspC domain-containing protein [Clostridia bacterium]